MKRKSSYQRRKENIKYLEQCCEELEAIAKHLAVDVCPSHISKLLKHGIKGDTFLTSYNMGSFTETLMDISLKAHLNG
jgi:hypothetical protein